MKWIFAVILIGASAAFGEPAATSADATADAVRERDALRTELAQSKQHVEQLQQELKKTQAGRNDDDDFTPPSSSEKSWVVKVISNSLQDAAAVKLQLQERKDRLAVLEKQLAAQRDAYARLKADAPPAGKKKKKKGHPADVSGYAANIADSERRKTFLAMQVTKLTQDVADADKTRVVVALGTESGAIFECIGQGPMLETAKTLEPGKLYKIGGVRQQFMGQVRVLLRQIAVEAEDDEDAK